MSDLPPKPEKLSSTATEAGKLMSDLPPKPEKLSSTATRAGGRSQRILFFSDQEKFPSKTDNRKTHVTVASAKRIFQRQVANSRIFKKN